VSTLKPPLNARDHVRGNPEAPIQLVEYGDYECPFCGRAHLVVKAIEQALGDDLLYAFRHFPLTQVHPHAMRAAQAAEAAALQGGFWKMHDMLFTHQDALDEPHLFSYAELCGLDMEQFARDIDSDEVAERVRSDFLSGARSGVNGTPTFFVNGTRYEGSWEPNTFLAVLRQLLVDESEALGPP
jgi:protein-disulfide isomerase